MHSYLRSNMTDRYRSVIINHSPNLISFRRGYVRETILFSMIMGSSSAIIFEPYPYGRTSRRSFPISRTKTVPNLCRNVSSSHPWYVLSLLLTKSPTESIIRVKRELLGLEIDFSPSGFLQNFKIPQNILYLFKEKLQSSQTEGYLSTDVIFFRNLFSDRKLDSIILL